MISESGSSPGEGIGYPLQFSWGPLVAQKVKKSTRNGGDLGLIPGLGKSPGGGYGNPLQYSCLENPYGQRSLVGYSPWGHKESDTTERLSTYYLFKKALSFLEAGTLPCYNYSFITDHRILSLPITLLSTE